MSSRDLTGVGDLIPQDVAEVFAQERSTQRSRRKRSKSLGRAFGWLSRKKKKDINANGESVGMGAGLDLAIDGLSAGHQGGQKGAQKAGKHPGKQAHPQGNTHAGQKEEEKEMTPLFQENVFIEGSRPKHLEDLHIEAQEGLKLMQQEENKNGVDYRDDESSISTVTHRHEDDSQGFLTDSTIPDTSSMVSTQSTISTISTRSTRSGITRQASTFRPLNSGMKSEKTRTRKRHRKTVMGIPQHVQRELGLDRLDRQLSNGDTMDSPTIDGGGVGIQAPGVCSTETGHKDDLALLQVPGHELGTQQRPHSLAVPWLTTASSLQQHPPSPVMSMSPQATYLSKIIPNAVMPPSIDVVEISRGRSRNSVRTVSKSSLLLASPAFSRASSRASSKASSKASTISSASRYNPPYFSDSSGWSRSESSETLVSDSSTISSSSTPRQRSQQGDGGRTSQEGFAKDDQASMYSSVSKASERTSNGKPKTKEGQATKEGAFIRSLSVIKCKQAPPPPNRSYSLHKTKVKRHSREVRPGESCLDSVLASGGESGGKASEAIKEAGSSPVLFKVTDGTGYTADTSSLDDSTGSMSLSPTKPQLLQASEKESVRPKEPTPKDASPEKQQQPQWESGLEKAVSPSSGYSSQGGTPTQASQQCLSPVALPKHKRSFLAKLQSLFPGSSSSPVLSCPSPLMQPEAARPAPPDSMVVASPSVSVLRELFNIPPPPKVRAPPPPPPEVWAHSKRTFELLLGPPAPNDIQAIVKKNPKDRRQQRCSPTGSREGSVKSLTVERNQKINSGHYVQETTNVQESVRMYSEGQKENIERLEIHVLHTDVEGNGKVTGEDELVNGTSEKAMGTHEERNPAPQQEVTQMAACPQISLAEIKKTMDTLSAIKLTRVSPSPSPLLTQHAPLPPRTQAATLSIPDTPSVPAPEPVMSPWPPPPPPPMDPAAVNLDEMDFPPPPPLLFSEEALGVGPSVPPTTVTHVSSSGRADAPIIPVVGSVECVRMVAETAAATSSVSEEHVSAPLRVPPQIIPSLPHGIPPPPQSIAPPPPSAVPYPPAKDFTCLSAKVVTPILAQKAAPPPATQAAPPPAAHAAPPPAAKTAPPPAAHAAPPPAAHAAPPPATKAAPPPAAKAAPPPAAHAAPPPAAQAAPPPAAHAAPPPAAHAAPPPAAKAAPPPAAHTAPPPAAKTAPPPATKTAPPPATKTAPPPAAQAAPPPAAHAAPPPAAHAAPPPDLVAEKVSSLPAVLPAEKATSPSNKEATPLLDEKVTSAGEVAPPETTTSSTGSLSPPPPPLLPQETSPSQSNSPASVADVTPLPESIHPPSPSKPLPPPEVIPPLADGGHPSAQHLPSPPPADVPVPATLETPPVAPEHAPAPPESLSLSPPQPAQEPATDTRIPTANQTSVSAPEQEPVAVVTPSLLQTVKLKSVSDHNPTKAQSQASTKVTVREPQSNKVTSVEAPQKPIRRSLIMTSPTSTSPPETVLSQPATVKAHSSVVLPTPSSTVTSPAKKSTPAMGASPSMNLQEAIRLRTAARSKDGPSSRLSLLSPTSPPGSSPSSMASFVFSKSTKKVVINTASTPEAQANLQKNLVAELSSVSKPDKDAESHKKGLKMPPLVAKKPKGKTKETEENENMQTAGQDAQPESTDGTPEKQNGTADAVEGRPI